MRVDNVPVPNLTTAYQGPLHHAEKTILNQVATIESWFRSQWQLTPAPLTSSVDLRHAGFKLAPIDTNLFPAGFNNLNRDFLPLCIQAIQATLSDYLPKCKRILLLPESHTRNRFYMESLGVLYTILVKSGFVVRIGSLDPELLKPQEIALEKDESLLIEPLVRKENRLSLADFEPCLIVLNNDLSTGIPESLQGLQQAIMPTAKLGWSSRLKSNHFQLLEQVIHEFATVINVDPWFINPAFTAVGHIDFMSQDGIDELANQAEQLLKAIQEKYRTYGIEEDPFIVVKADNGTYGMSVMTVTDAQELRTMNRKQRTRMATSKGSQKVDKVIIQEGVYTFETMPDGAVAEPVVYMIGPFVVGGFYRVHQNRGTAENLNAPGMHFEHLAFAEACNMPNNDPDPVTCPNRFYIYGVIARLAALAAAREIAAVGE